MTENINYSVNYQGQAICVLGKELQIKQGTPSDLAQDLFVLIPLISSIAQRLLEIEKEAPTATASSAGEFRDRDIKPLSELGHIILREAASKFGIEDTFLSILSSIDKLNPMNNKNHTFEFGRLVLHTDILDVETINMYIIQPLKSNPKLMGEFNTENRFLFLESIIEYMYTHECGSLSDFLLSTVLNHERSAGFKFINFLIIQLDSIERDSDGPISDKYLTTWTQISRMFSIPSIFNNEDITIPENIRSAMIKYQKYLLNMNV